MAAKRGGGAERRWRALIRDQERSGLSIAKFAHRRDVSPATFYWWRSRLARRVHSGRAPRIVAVDVVESDAVGAPRPDRGFELELSHGRRLHVPAHFDAQELSRLILAVESAC